MTGRLRLGKMSTFMRDTARPLPNTMPAMATMTLMGWRRAKVIGFMRSLLQLRSRSAFSGSRRAALLADRVKRLIVILHDLGDQLVDFRPRLPQDFSSCRGRPVVAAAPAANRLDLAAKVAAALQLVQSRIKGSLAKPVA